MNYELAKQLDDAGFPNADKRCSYCIEQSNDSCTECEDRTIGLSELIEACGDEFISLKRTNMVLITGGYGTLEIENPQGIKWLCNSYESSKLIEGSTAEEAVANLWLALNSKQ